MIYKFIVGQTVYYSPRGVLNAAASPYRICQLMPEGDNDRATPRYRIKSMAERHERVVPESDLTQYEDPEHVLTT
jgi:hypothetical protein